MNYGKYATWAQANRADDWRKIDAGPGQSLPALDWGKLSATVCQAYLDSQQSARSPADLSWGVMPSGRNSAA